MVRKKRTQVASLVLSIAVLILHCLPVANESVGIYAGSGWLSHFTYQFFHASWLHAVVNCWALLTIAFSQYDVSLRMLIIAFLVAASFPIDSLEFLYPEAIPTIGLSGMIYALLGRITFQTARRWYYLSWISVFILASILMPKANGWLHLYCFLVGILLSFLNEPQVWRKR